MVFNSMLHRSSMSQPVGTVDVYQNLVKFGTLSINAAPEHNKRLQATGTGTSIPSIAELQLTNRIALDCEMVGIGKNGKEHMVARVSLVNEFGNVLVDCYVKPQHPVKDYRTNISGIRPELIEHGVEFAAIRELVRKIIYGRILVGHSLNNDLLVLQLRHPKYSIRDTSRYRAIAKKVHSMGTPSLKSLAKALLGITIQNGTHDSVEDAQTVMKIYLLFEKQWEDAVKQSCKF
ncbi:RNA exonuclease 4 [Anopheles ziemanni]|uniref:RNA exonuclease 4 n=1 Tax=Anopheles coustani TaxID=139045 RepID=UPI00265A4596|nr:RNA exonuclease 4 [Anopheles coustani]XP_058175558.1 RNA exonuclease 4 [Anopheles ziemanni]